ncbi:MAG: hypothetical protein PHC51_03235 [bacterium]|nr:hypothetical protein [bacterium]
MTNIAALAITALVILLFTFLRKSRARAEAKATEQNLAFETLLDAQGFQTSDPQDSCLTPVIAALATTNKSIHSDSAYKHRTRKDEYVCRLHSSGGESITNHLVVTVPRRNSTNEDWIIYSTPSIIGFAAKMLQKVFDITLKEAGYRSIESPFHNQGNATIFIYTKGGSGIPACVDSRLIQALSEHGSVILRTAGNMLLIEELVSLKRGEPLAEELQTLLKIAESLKPLV